MYCDATYIYGTDVSTKSSHNFQLALFASVGLTIAEEVCCQYIVMLYIVLLMYQCIVMPIYCDAKYHTDISAIAGLINAELYNNKDRLHRQTTIKLITMFVKGKITQSMFL